MDLLLDTDPLSSSYGDLTWKNGPLTPSYTTQSRVDVVAQRLLIRLRNFEGEWFLDTSYGVPYWSILGHKIKKSAKISLWKIRSTADFLILCPRMN